jgi:hypothetical protein
LTNRFWLFAIDFRAVGEGSSWIERRAGRKSTEWYIGHYRRFICVVVDIVAGVVVDVVDIRRYRTWVCDLRRGRVNICPAFLEAAGRVISLTVDTFAELTLVDWLSFDTDGLSSW